MPLRLSCRVAGSAPGSIVPSYWGPRGLHRPRIDVHLIGPGGATAIARAAIDTAADFNLFGDQVGYTLGLTLPFPRRQAISGAAGTQSSGVSFPPDGLVSLFVTDYVEYCYLPSPLLGFHDPGAGQATQRSVLGLTGFLQHFRFVLDHGASPPEFELHPLPSFPGRAGPLPRDRPLADFLRGLRSAP